MDAEKAAEDRARPRAAGSNAQVARVPSIGCGASTGTVSPKKWPPSWLVAGPLGFAGLGMGEASFADRPEAFEPKPGKSHRLFKSGAGLKRKRTVKIVVPKSERPGVQLAYVRGKSKENRFVQRLRACKHRNSGFPGGFRVAGPRCSKIRVRVEGRNRPIKRIVSFGGGECSKP